MRLEVKQRDIQLERGERQWQTADSERQTLELQLHDLQATLQSTVTYMTPPWSGIERVISSSGLQGEGSK